MRQPGRRRSTRLGAAVVWPVGLVAFVAAGVWVAAGVGAFALRAAVWRQVLPGLSFGQAWAAIHVSLAANHVLPFRLGEPLRVVSAMRRSDQPLDAVAAS